MDVINIYKFPHFPGGSVVKNLPANAGDARDMGLIPGSGRSPGKGNGNQLQCSWTSLVAQTVKIFACNVGDPGLIPGSGRFPGGGHGNPLQYSCLENSTDRGAWWATVYRVAKRQTQLKRLSMHTQNVLGSF